MRCDGGDGRLQLSLRYPAPGYDRNSALLSLLVRGDLEYPVPPDDVHVPTEGVDGPVRLRHGYDSLGLGMFEGGVSFTAETDAHSEVLSPCLVRLHCCSVVVERLPLGGVAVPVEPGGLDVHLKIVSDPLHHGDKGGTFFLPVLLEPWQTG